MLCPRRCGVNRNEKEYGFCGLDSNVRIARASLHFWEEPELSGEAGSGTVFFAGCNLKCVYCQNYGISRYRDSAPVSVSLSEQTSGYLPEQESGVKPKQPTGSLSKPVSGGMGTYDKPYTLSWQ